MIYVDGVLLLVFLWFLFVSAVFSYMCWCPVFSYLFLWQCSHIAEQQGIAPSHQFWKLETLPRIELQIRLKYCVAFTNFNQTLCLHLIKVKLIFWVFPASEMILRLNCNSLTNWQYKGVPHTMRLYQLNISQVFKVFMRKCSNIQTPTIVADRYIFLYTFLGYYITDLYIVFATIFVAVFSHILERSPFQLGLEAQLEGESNLNQFAVMFEESLWGPFWTGCQTKGESHSITL